MRSLKPSRKFTQPEKYSGIQKIFGLNFHFDDEFSIQTSEPNEVLFN